MQEILYLVVNGANTAEAESRPLHERVPFIEANVPGRFLALDVLRQQAAPRLIKTHLPSHFFHR